MRFISFFPFTLNTDNQKNNQKNETKTKRKISNILFFKKLNMFLQQLARFQLRTCTHFDPSLDNAHIYMMALSYAIFLNF